MGDAGMSVGSRQKRPAPTLSALALILVAIVTASFWRADTSSGYGAAYVLAASSEKAQVSFTTTSGATLVDGGTYGVGTVIVAKFDGPVADRAAAEKQLAVKTVPPVEGSWYWIDNQRAHWRPQSYYSPGTEVVATANSQGADDAAGRGRRVSFRIGESHVSIADDATKQIRVYRNDELVRTIPTSMGMGGSETVAGNKISFWTQPGIYTVMDKAESVVMDSSTYGLPVDSRLGYKLTVSNAVRLTNSGIYVHQLDSTVWAQGKTNTSHGCLNVNADNGRWFYEFSQPGDVFEVRNTGGDPLPVWQNGDWGVPWDKWLGGSALR
ncbi:L,D-transpeptidase [Mycolicibacterium setense]|nr:Ig-like domain-containing protein [Mycolicibacterium setense]